MQTFSILEVHFHGIFGNVTSFKSIGHCDKKKKKLKLNPVVFPQFK